MATLSTAAVLLASSAFADERVPQATGAATAQVALDQPPPDPSLTLKPPTKSDSVYDPTPEEKEQVLGGHLFIFPVLQEPAFMTTHVAFTQALELLSVPDAPVRPGRTYDVSALGVDELIRFGARFLDRYEASLGAAAAAYSGSGIKSALIGGAGYWFNGQVGLGMRIWRGRRTQFSARIGGTFGATKRVEFINVIDDVASAGGQQTVDDIINGNLGRRVVTPASSDALNVSFHLAHALSRAFGFQGTFGVAENWFRLSLFHPDERRIHGEITTPELAAALTYDLRPLVSFIPIELIGEYSVRWSYVATQEPGLSKWLEAQQIVGGGAFYSGRPDLQIGLHVRRLLTFETTQGFDANGRPFPMGKPELTALELTLRYIW